MPELLVRPIHVPTCEDTASGGEVLPLWPSTTDEQITLFPLHDPFGVRKAVVPLFLLEPGGNLSGLGTAFALDPWGSFMTADHVVEEARRHGRTTQEADARYRTTMPEDLGLVALVGMGLVYGTAQVPPNAILPVIGGFSPALPQENPLPWATSTPDHRPLDIAVLETRRPSEGDVHNLLIRSEPPYPVPGEYVVAIGFPEIKTFSGSQGEARTIIAEQMKVAYGRVTQLHPEGRDGSNPTPVFEVEANWPSGMSGGPALNARGEVIGIVSRSLAPETPNGLGVGWATWLGIFSDLPKWAPMLDPVNLEWRRGWGGVVRENPWHLAGMFRTEEEVINRRGDFGGGYVVRRGCNRHGTDDLM